MITRKETNPNGYIETPEISMNLNVLEDRLNKLILSFGAPIYIITSGLRSEADQARINPNAPQSKHLIGGAADVSCKHGALKNWVINNSEALKHVQLWCEDPGFTSTWVHFQIFPPKSGKRFFIP